MAGAQLARALASDLNTDEVLSIISPGQHQSAKQAVQKALAGCSEAPLRVRIDTQIDPGHLSEIGGFFVPDPVLSRWAPLRSGSPANAFSLVGVIHTVCSEGALNGIASIPHAALHPWDAVVCTSTAGRDVVSKAIQGRLDAMASRLGVVKEEINAYGLPRLPVIPLAANAIQPFAPGKSREQRRFLARQALGISGESFVVSFVGRLSFHSKCHPISLYRALNALAQLRPEVDIVLIECGHIFNDSIAGAYAELRSLFPDISFRLVGGLEPASDIQKWQVLAASDVFTSPSDNLQETFGLSLLEAMAAELPIVASDWNGYRDLVEDGVTGFLVPTRDLLVDRPAYDDVDLQYALGEIDYDSMIGMRSMSVEVDHDAYLRSFDLLLASSELRRSMASAGLKRLHSNYSPAAVSAKYRDLWLELAEIRRAHDNCETTGSLARRNFPATSTSDLFAHYATSGFGSDLDLAISISGETRRYASLIMNSWLVHCLSGGDVLRFLDLINRHDSLSRQQLLDVGFNQAQSSRLFAFLLKHGATRL